MRRYRCIKETSTNVLHTVGSEKDFPEGVTPSPEYWVPVGGMAGQAAGVPQEEGKATVAAKPKIDERTCARMVFETMGKDKELRLTKMADVRQAYAKALDEARTMLAGAGVDVGNEQDVDALMALWTEVFTEQPAAGAVKK